MLNRAQYPSDIIALVVLWRLRYKLALRDLPEMFAVRGMVFRHEAVREWAKLTPVLADDLRLGRPGALSDDVIAGGAGVRWLLPRPTSQAAYLPSRFSV